MFEARLTEGIVFKQIIESINSLVNDVNIDCTEDEMVIQCMDSAHVSLVYISLNAAAFEHFRCDREQKLGFNTSNMSKIMKMMGRNDALVLKAEEEAESLSMMFENEKCGTISDFELKLMNINADQLSVPDTPYKCTIQMPSNEFQRIIRDLQVMGDTCKISCTKEGIRFSATGPIGTANILQRSITTSENDHENVTIDMEEPVELNFALRYLNFFTRATPLSKKVIICMSPGIPIVVEYPIDQIGFVKYYLAPKVEEDGDDE